MEINRRKFFKWLGVGAAVAVVAPYVPLPKEPPLSGWHFDTVRADDVLSEYGNYVNFSSFAIAASLDDCVANAAAELGAAAGRAAGREITTLELAACGN
jgi:hypothetical protein